MKTLYMRLLVLFVLLTTTLKNNSATVISGLYTLPGNVAGTQVNNLTDLANLLNVDSVVGGVVFEFTASYSSSAEVYPVVFNYYKGYGGVTIRPAASVNSPLVTSGNPDSVAMIEFNYAYKYTFDGRAGGTGSAQEWTFQNTAVNGSYPVFLLQNSSVDDTLRYLNILASGNLGSANVYFGSSNVGNGNSGDVLDHCNIGNYAGYPFNPVYAYGTNNAKPNSHIQISNNNIYNYQNMISSPVYAGINIAYGGNTGNFTITGNSLYSTINPATLAGWVYYGIYFSPGSTSFNNVVSGNYIGGQQPQCGGAPWGVPSGSGSNLTDMDAIYVNAAYTLVSGNTIQNIDMANKHASATFRGIVIGGGSARVAYNTIGSDSVANSIHNGLWGTTLGIDAATTDTTTIDHNLIANLTADGEHYSADSSGGVTTGCTVGVYVGVNNNAPGPAYISHNTVHGIFRTDYYNGASYYQLTSGGGSSAYPITTTGNNIMAGIAIESGSGYQYTVTKNTIYNLYDSVTGGTYKVYINGIIAPLSPVYINANLIYNLWAPDLYGGSGAYYGITGIYMPGSGAYAYDVTNNEVRLGYKQDGTPVQNALISGIWDNSGYGPNHKVHCLHNSVYIGGADNNIAGNNLNSFAMRRDFNYTNTTYDSALIRNNIFINDRSNSNGTGVNYGLYLYSTVNLATDYNDVYSNGTNYAYGNIAGADYQTAVAFRAQFPALEGHSIAQNPLFVSETGITPDMHVATTSPINAVGSAATTIVYDFDSLTRSYFTPTDMGASVVCTAYSNMTGTLQVTQDTFCTGTQLVFSASAVNGGLNPVCNFYRNGISVQNALGTAYGASNLHNGDSVFVIMTSQANCILPDTAKTNVIHLVETPDTIVPSVNISISPDTGCQTIQFSITATPNSAGYQTSYYFYADNRLLQASSNGLCRTQALLHNDSIYVVLHATGVCLATNTVTSNVLYPDIIKLDTASLTITASPAGVTCTGTPVTFTANPVHGGTSPTYIWQKNGVVVGNNGPTYTNTLPHNGDVIKCQLQTSETCAVYQNYISTITMVVDTASAPAVSIAANPAGSICTGTHVTFTATHLNGGNNPVYQWTKNGIVTASTSTTYTDSTLATGDSIKCRMVTTSACAGADTVFSNVYQATVLPVVAPSVTLAATPSTTVCAGSAVTVLATPVNAGTLPSYQWKKNGTNVTGNDSVYTSSMLADGDQVSCVITSHAQCTVPSTAVSDTLTMHINPTAASTVTGVFCAGHNYTYNGRTYTQQGNYHDTLSTVLGCDSVITLMLTATPAVTSTLNNTICNGNFYNFNGRTLNTTGTFYDTLTAASTTCDSIVILHLTVRAPIVTHLSAGLCNGGSYAFNGRTLTTTGTYTDTLTSASGCDSVVTLVLNTGHQLNSSLTATICDGDPYNFFGQTETTGGVYTHTIVLPGGCDSVITLTLTARPKPDAVIVRGGNDSLYCTTANIFSYQWLLNGAPINGATRANYVAHQNGSYSVIVHDQNGCTDTSAAADIQDLGIGNIASDMDIELYPNPSTGLINVSVSGISSSITIQVIDLVGNTLQTTVTGTVNGNYNTLLDLNKYADGVYLVEFIGDGVKTVRRIEVVR